METRGEFTAVFNFSTALTLGFVPSGALISGYLGNVLAPTSAIGALYSKFNLALVAFSGACVCSLLNLSDQKEVIKRLPVSLWIMICGITTLVGLAQHLGAMAYLATLIGDGIPKWLLVPMFALLAGLMELFISFNAIIPMLMPVAVGVATTAGINPLILLTAVYAGCVSTTISPFTSGGIMTMSQCPDEKEREKLFGKQFRTCFISLAFVTVLLTLGMASILA